MGKNSELAAHLTLFEEFNSGLILSVKKMLFYGYSGKYPTIIIILTRSNHRSV